MGGKFVITQCAGGLTCAALPLVNKRGTVSFCFVWLVLGVCEGSCFSAMSSRSLARPRLTSKHGLLRRGHREVVGGMIS